MLTQIPMHDRLIVVHTDECHWSEHILSVYLPDTCQARYGGRGLVCLQMNQGHRIVDLVYKNSVH